MRRLLFFMALSLGLFAAGLLVTPADACPMCKFANEDGSEDGQDSAAMMEANRRPRAYMYSILFMISMPVTIFAGFSYSFYRMSRKQRDLTHVSLDGPLDS